MRRRLSGWSRVVVVSVTSALVMGSWTAVAAGDDPVEPVAAAPAGLDIPAGAAPVDPGVLTSAAPVNGPGNPGVVGDFANDPSYSPIDSAAPLDDPAPRTGFDPDLSTVVERTATEDIYQNPDGSRTAIVSSTTINAIGADGEYQPVDTALVEATAGDVAEAGEEAGQADVSVRPELHPLDPVFGETAADGAVSVAAGEVSALVTPVEVTSEAPAEVVTGGESSQVTYQDSVAGSDLVYEVTSGAVKESIVLDTAPGVEGAASWSFWLDVAGGTPSVTENGSVEIVNGDGDLVMGMPLPYVFDSAAVPGVREAADINGAYTLDQVDGRWRLTVSVDRAWLNDPARVYPVMVDPTLGTVQYDSSQSFKSDGTVAVGELKFGSPVDNGKMWRGVTHFDIAPYLDDNLQVIDAQINFHVTGSTEPVKLSV